MNRFSPSIIVACRSLLHLSLRSLSTNSAAAAAAAAAAATEFGFRRSEFGREKLAGTVRPYDRHVFLCYGSPDTWQSAAESSDGMPRLLSSAITARKGNMKRKTKLTMCKGEDNDEYCSSGESADVLIFPDMIRYRQLRCSDVDSFVEDVLVREAQWSSGSAEGMMESSHIFICAHGNRDRRCGVCGPVLVSKFQEVMSPKFQGQVCVKPCSHVGGHKYAGNVIVFNRDVNGEVSGHWYGYVAPEDAPLLVEEHIGKGNIVDRLWRGQMGLSPEDQRKAQNLRLQSNDEAIQATKTQTDSNQLTKE